MREPLILRHSLIKVFMESFKNLCYHEVNGGCNQDSGVTAEISVCYKASKKRHQSGDT